MKKLLLGTVALVALGATVPALAADLGARAPYYQGSGLCRADLQLDRLLYRRSRRRRVRRRQQPVPAHDGRFLGGVQGGFDYQFAPSWVLGIEAQYSWLSSNNNGRLFPGGVLVTSNNDQLGSVTGRLGYTWGPALLYAKGGYAWKDGNNLNVTTNGAAGGLFHQRQPS